MRGVKEGHILIVDTTFDSLGPAIAELEGAGFRVMKASTVAEARAMATAARKPELAVIEWTLPSGPELVKRLGLPSIVISTRPNGVDAVVALELGAVDYLGRPFDPPVFVARVRAALRRSAIGASSDAVLLGELEVNVRARSVYCAGTRVELSRSEFAVLEALLGARGRVLSRKSLIAQVIGEDAGVTSRVIDTHVFTLRRKLGVCGKRVQTVRGVGYRLD